MKDDQTIYFKCWIQLRKIILCNIGVSLKEAILKSICWQPESQCRSNRTGDIARFLNQLKVGENCLL